MVHFPALVKAKVYSGYGTVYLLASRAKFTLQSAQSVPGVPEYPGTCWMSVLRPWARRDRALWLIYFTSLCPGSGPSGGVHQIGACESVKTATVFTLCCCSISHCSIITSCASLILGRSVSKHSIRPVYTNLLCDFHRFLQLHTVMSRTQPLSEHNLSVHHTLTAALNLVSFPITQCCGVQLAVLVSCSVLVVTTDSLPRDGQFMPGVVQPYLCFSMATVNIGQPEEEFWCNVFHVSLHATATVGMSRCCLESKIPGVGVSADSLIIVPHGVVGGAPRMNLACQLR
jgi:hypothetical protein